MEITAPQSNSLTTPLQPSPTAENEIKHKDQDTTLSSESTVNLSSKAQNTSAQDEKQPTSQITSKEAKQLVEGFQASAANTPDLTQQALSNNVNTETVSSLFS